MAQDTLQPPFKVCQRSDVPHKPRR
ncbi:unnamed protein product [Cuscuta epithymum]|uniref:Uncharacterized protein n=1 Tax=Cuscuta epithymum TaxID=186058 RepID=A0AAV0CTN5_9ASTE|nr:unnamed protein product [Cuscuta epithymum]CAH9126244.1 unnamed protein product [Cuscuta epithymum]CAH9130363.1 unnamed protein product [Cuscuta epithymum]